MEEKRQLFLIANFQLIRVKKCETENHQGAISTVIITVGQEPSRDANISQ